MPVSIPDPDADPSDFYSLPFHRGILKAHLAHRLEATANDLATSISEKIYRGTADRLRIVRDNLVESDRTGARWFRWPLDAEVGVLLSPRPDIGLPTDPRSVHEQWSGLSAAEREDRYRADPFLGNRDGIPQADRDRYNRRTLGILRERAEREGNQDHLDRIDDIQRFLDSTEEGLPPHFLSYIDDELRYVYALGNPDTADNVTVALVGALRRRSGVGYAEQSLKQLRQAALAVDPTAETSVVLWGAYDNPNSLVATLRSTPAEEGAPAVRSFHEGLRATHEGTPSHNTTIAHSYGGVLGGHSAGHGNALDTDALVFVGSWGTGATHVGDLRLAGAEPALSGERVFATMAQHDSIQLMPATHGPAPTDPAFGATVFHTDSTPSERQLGWNPADHLATNYFGSGNSAYRSLGMIMTGYGELLR
ncbi:alpha/beta hydrolase [Nocardia sp. X0981]